MKKAFILLLVLFSIDSKAQEKPGVKQFWENLQKLCGKA